MNERVPTGCGSCRVCNRRAPVVSAASRIPSELLGVPGAGGAVPNGQIKITEGLCPARRRRESSFHSTAEEGQQRKERHASPRAEEGTSCFTPARGRNVHDYLLGRAPDAAAPHHLRRRPGCGRLAGPDQPGRLGPHQRFARLPRGRRPEARDRAGARRVGGRLQLGPGHPAPAERRLHRVRAAQPAARPAVRLRLPARLPHPERGPGRAPRHPGRALLRRAPPPPRPPPRPPGQTPRFCRPAPSPPAPHPPPRPPRPAPPPPPPLPPPPRARPPARLAAAPAPPPRAPHPRRHPRPPSPAPPRPHRHRGHPEGGPRAPQSCPSRRPAGPPPIPSCGPGTGRPPHSYPSGS